MRTLARTLILLAVALGPSSARALPSFPKALKDLTDAPCLPRCTVCHRDDSAGADTVDRPFGESYVEAGGAVLLSEAVKRLRDEETDSDGDGTADIAELTTGHDPNTAYEATICGPEAGCGLSGGRDAAPLWLGLLGALMLRARKRVG